MSTWFRRKKKLKLLEVAKTAFYFTGAAFFAVLIGATVATVQYARTDLAPKLAARDAQIASLLETVNTSSKIDAINTERAIANLTQVTVDTGETIDRFNEALFADKFGLIPESITLAHKLSKVADDTDEVAQTLNNQLAMTGDVARTDFEQAGAVLATVQQAVAVNSEATATALASVNEAVESTNRVIANPEIPATITNVQEATKSVDQSLRSLRSKAGTVKKIFLMLLQPAAELATKLF